MLGEKLYSPGSEYLSPGQYPLSKRGRIYVNHHYFFIVCPQYARCPQTEMPGTYNKDCIFLQYFFKNFPNGVYLVTS